MIIDFVPRAHRIYGSVLLWLNIVVFILSFWAFPAYRAMEGGAEYVHWIMQATFVFDALLAMILLKGGTKPVAPTLFITSTVYFLCKLIPFINNGEDGIVGLIVFGFICYLDLFVWLLIDFGSRKIESSPGVGTH